MLSPIKGFLVEYALSLPPLMLAFDFNPQSLTRNRSITLTLGSTPATRGGYDFALPTETARVAQGVSVEPESFDVEILLDATDRMNDGDPIAQEIGIQPELDTLRSMVEPKTQGPGAYRPWPVSDSAAAAPFSMPRRPRCCSLSGACMSCRCFSKALRWGNRPTCPISRPIGPR